MLINSSLSPETTSLTVLLPKLFFKTNSDVMLIDSDSEFFKYLNDKKDQN